MHIAGGAGFKRLCFAGLRCRRWPIDCSLDRGADLWPIWNRNRWPGSGQWKYLARMKTRGLCGTGGTRFGRVRGKAHDLVTDVIGGLSHFCATDSADSATPGQPSSLQSKICGLQPGRKSPAPIEWGATEAQPRRLHGELRYGSHPLRDNDPFWQYFPGFRCLFRYAVSDRLVLEILAPSHSPR